MALVLAGVPLELEVPAKMSERWAPLNAIRRPGCEALAVAAALGLCCPKLRRHVPYGHDVLTYGAEVIDFLTSPNRRQSRKRPDGTMEELYPATYAEVQQAGGAAFDLCMNNLVDVEGAVDFTSPPGATPTAGGPNSGGGWTPVN